MYLVSLRIESSCGLASASHKLNQTIFSLNAYPINGNLNSVFSLLVTSNKRRKDAMHYLIKELRKDFLNIHILPNKVSNIIVFTGVKRGHGVLYPIMRNNAILILPTIANDNYEAFNFLAYDKEQINEVISEVSRYNVIDYVTYERITNADVLMDLLMRRIKELILYDLSDYELSILRAAYMEGYFAWPKGIDINSLAQKIGVSKPMISYYLRRAMKKILDKILTT